MRDLQQLSASDDRHHSSARGTAWASAARDSNVASLVPISTYDCVYRIYHEDGDRGWPRSLALPVDATLCDFHGRVMPSIRRPSEEQLAAMDNVVRSIDPARVASEAAIPEISSSVRRRARAHGWPPVPGDVLLSPLPGLQCYLIDGILLSRLVLEGASVIWTDSWIYRMDPYGDASSSILATIGPVDQIMADSGVSHRRLSHNSVWPPICQLESPSLE